MSYTLEQIIETFESHSKLVIEGIEEFKKQNPGKPAEEFNLPEAFLTLAYEIKKLREAK